MFMNNPKYILHTTPESNLDKIEQDWFLYRNWYPTVSASLPFVVHHALKQWYKEKPNTIWELRKILIMKSPEDKIINTGYKAVISINEEKKEIHWSPRIWASARMQWWIYDTREIVQNTLPSKLCKFSNKEIKQFAIGEGYDKQNKLKQDTVGMISPTEVLYSITWDIRKKIRNLEKINISEYEKKIKEEITNNKSNKIYSKSSIDDIVENLIESTVQQESINFIRNIFLIIKESKWYKIFNQDEQISIMERHPDLLQNLKSFRDTVNHIIDGKYDFDLTWSKKLQPLNTYLRIYINKLCKELD